MDLLKKTLTQITFLNYQAMDKVQEQLNHRFRDAARMGKLGEMVKQYVGITEEYPPSLPRKCMILAAADHGVAELGVSAYPIETTATMTRNYLVAKGAGANALANYCQADIVVVDVGVAANLSDIPGLLHRKIAYGTKNFTVEPAMSREQAIESIEIGIEIVNERIKQGYRCFSLGEMGIGNTTASAAIVASFAGLSAVEVTGRGTGISDNRLQRKIDAVRRALELNKPNPADGIDVLAKVGGFELGVLAGVILGAAAKRAMVIIDGFNASAAGLLAKALQPLSVNYMLGSHLSAEPAHLKALEILGLDAYIDMGLRLGEATGASLAMDLLDSAINIFNKNGPFQSSNKDKLMIRMEDSLSLIEDSIQRIGLLDNKAMKQCQLRIDNLCKPLGSLGCLENLAVKMAGITGCVRPDPLKKCSVLLESETNRVARSSAEQIFQTGTVYKSTINTFDSDIFKDLLVTEFGLSANSTSNASMSQQIMQAVGIGIMVAKEQIANGIKVVGLGVKFNNKDKIDGASRSDGLLAKISEMSLDPNKSSSQNLIDILINIGEIELAALVGVILASAAGQAAVVLDGAYTSLAAFVAITVSPHVKEYLVGSHVSANPVHDSALKAIGIPAYLNLDIPCGNGLGASLGISLIDASLHILNDMKTFAETKVPVAHDGPGKLKQRLNFIDNNMETV